MQHTPNLGRDSDVNYILFLIIDTLTDSPNFTPNRTSPAYQSLGSAKTLRSRLADHEEDVVSIVLIDSIPPDADPNFPNCRGPGGNNKNAQISPVPEIPTVNDNTMITEMSSP